MRLLLYIFLASIFSLPIYGQNMDYSMFKRIDKDQFNELKKTKNRFVPEKFEREGLILRKYSYKEIVDLKTAGLLKTVVGQDSTRTLLKQILSESNGELKIIRKLYTRDRKKLSKYFNRIIVLDSMGIDSASVDDFRHELRISIVYHFEHLYDVAWFVSIRPYFYDRLEKENYEVFAPLNYEMGDLLK